MENQQATPDNDDSPIPTTFLPTASENEAFDISVEPQTYDEDNIAEQAEETTGDIEAVNIEESDIELGNSTKEGENNILNVSSHEEVNTQYYTKDLHQRSTSVPPGENVTMISRPQSSMSYCNRMKKIPPKIATRLTCSSVLDVNSWNKTKINSTVLRQAVYEKWYFTRASKFQQHMQDLKHQQSSLQKAQQQERDARRKEAHIIYQSWKNQKETYLAQERKKAERLAEKERQEEKLRKEKQDDAIMAFKSWKSQKDEMLREQRKEQEEAERRLKQKEEEEKKEKQMDAQSSFDAWKRRKNEEQQEASEAMLKTSLLSEMQDRDQKVQRDTEAVRAFEIWLNNKEFERHHRKATSNPNRRRAWNDRPPWLPPGRGCGCTDATCVHT